MRSALVFASACAAVAVAAASCGSHHDAASAVVDDAGGADVAVTEAGLVIPPYPPGPYGGGVGEVMPNFRLQGYALSRTERDSAKLPWRDISLAEVRATPGCECLVIAFSAAGSQCGPCLDEDHALSDALAADPKLCAIEAIFSNYDGAYGNGIDRDGGNYDFQPPTRADIDQMTRAQRENFPVGITTQEAVRALSAYAIPGVPTNFFLRVSDMRTVGFALGSTIAAEIKTQCHADRRVDTITSGISPRRLALDATNAYMTDLVRGVTRAPLAGGAAEVLAAPLATPDAIALDADNVYWATHEGAPGTTFEIGKVPKSGGSGAVVTSGPDGYVAIAVDDANVWFTRTDGTVGAVPLSGGPPLVVVAGRAALGALVVDASELFFVDDGDLYAAAKSAAAATRVVVRGADLPYAPRVFDVAQRQNELIVAVEGAATGTALYRVPKSGGEAVFLEGSPLGTALAVDRRGNILYGSSDPYTHLGVVAVLPYATLPSSGFFTVLTPGQPNVSAVASDGESTFWTVNGDDPAALAGSLRKYVP